MWPQLKKHSLHKYNAIHKFKAQSTQKNSTVFFSLFEFYFCLWVWLVITIQNNPQQKGHYWEGPRSTMAHTVAVCVKWGPLGITLLEKLRYSYPNPGNRHIAVRTVKKIQYPSYFHNGTSHSTKTWLQLNNQTLHKENAIHKLKFPSTQGKTQVSFFFLLTVDSLWGYGWKSPIRTFLNERVMNVEVLDVPRNIL